MADIKSASILILATDGYERSELRVPLEELRKQGAEVKIASIRSGQIRSWDEKDWGDSVSVDLLASEVKAEDFDAIVLPGGQINPDVLRAHDDHPLVAALPRISAVLDVASPEPLPADHPLWGSALAITGHQAGDSLAADDRCVALAVDQLRSYAEGRPLRNVVPR